MLLVIGAMLRNACKDFVFCVYKGISWNKSTKFNISPKCELGPKVIVAKTSHQMSIYGLSTIET